MVLGRINHTNQLQTVFTFYRYLVNRNILYPFLTEQQLLVAPCFLFIIQIRVYQTQLLPLFQFFPV